MIKQASKPDYSKMNEGELRLLLNKHQKMINNIQLMNGLPDKGQRLRNAIIDIEKILATSSSPMECDTIINQFNQMTMSSDDNEICQEKVHLENVALVSSKKPTDNNNFSEERLNEVKQRLKARQAERDSKATVTTTKLISLDEAIQLYNEEKIKREEHLVQQTTAQLLGNMSITKTIFGLPPTSDRTGLAYRKTATEEENDGNDDEDKLDQDKAEAGSYHDSDEIDYPDDEVENDDN